MNKRIISIISYILILSSCKKDFIDINQNPNEATSVTPNVVLSAALNGSGRDLGEDFLSVTRWMGYLARSGNYISDQQTEAYNITNSYTDASFQRLYTVLNRYDYIEKAGRSGKLPFYIGVAKTMKALHFSTLVDCYGDVPYSQAFQIAKTSTPAYDKGADIYKDLVNQLDSAVTYFDSAKNFYDNIATSGQISLDDKYDIIFGRGMGASADSRMDKWVQFANSIKLKLLLHQAAVIDPTYRAAEIAKIITNGRGLVDSSHSVTVNPGYANSTNQISPFYSNFYTVTGASDNYNYYRANTYAVNFYNSTGDGRQDYIYADIGTSVASNYDGDPNAQPNSAVSAIGTGILKSPSQDQPIFMDFESLFDQAEAVQRGWLTGNAEALYEAGITQSFVYVGEADYSDPVTDAGYYFSDGGLFAQGPVVDVNWEASPNKLEAIITQKWAALNCINWVEAWTDYRRTGFPTSAVLGISKAPIHIQPKIPIRFLYPQSEENSNGANVPKLPQNAQFNDPIFWDK